MTNRECIICDLPINADNPASDDDDDICALCETAAQITTREELISGGIDPDDSPIVLAAEIMKRIG